VFTSQRTRVLSHLFGEVPLHISGNEELREEALERLPTAGYLPPQEAAVRVP
jgi:hypothetical protein